MWRASAKGPQPLQMSSECDGQSKVLADGQSYSGAGNMAAVGG